MGVGVGVRRGEGYRGWGEGSEGMGRRQETTHLLAQLLQSKEEVGRGMTIPPLSLDGFHYQSSYSATLLVPLVNEVGSLLQTPLLLRLILTLELVQRVLENRKWCDGPIERRDV